MFGVNFRDEVWWGVALLVMAPLAVLAGDLADDPGAGLATALSAFALGVVDVVSGVVRGSRRAALVRARADQTPARAARSLVRANRLLAAVVAEESRALDRLLGEHGNFPEPALRRGDGEPLPLSELAGYYDSLPGGRLVVTGAAGSGKTVAATRLVLDLAAMAPERARFQVPVRLSLSSFTGRVRGHGVLGWIAEHLANAYRVPVAVGLELLWHGWVLPVLDGLDELEPARARRVATVLTGATGLGGSRLVLVCRTADPLGDTPTVEVLPLEVEQVAGWLEDRFPDAAVRERWAPVITGIRADPRGELAEVLTSPLRLHLAATVHGLPEPPGATDSGTPEERLLSGLVAAVVAAHPARGGRRLDPGRVRRWLSTLGQTPTIDLVALRPTAPDRLVAVLAALAVGAAVFASTVVAGLLVSGGPAVPWSAAAVGVVGAAVNLAAGRPRPVRVSTLGQRRGGDWWAAGLGAGVAVSAFVLSLASTPSGFGDLLGRVLLSGAGGVLATWVVFGTGQRRGVDRPSAVLRRVLGDDLSRFAVPVVLIGSAAACVATGEPEPVVGLLLSPVVGLLLGAPLGFLVGFAPSPLPRYWVAVGLARRADRLPPRPGRFLDWAQGAGLVRLTGDRAEFRHERVRAHLLRVSADGR
ncbi:NACHT domain-containing protein [Actinokineospora sp. PR83]|uniref:NACHT domain-containing protein n=1 Tax=Actinokineospora sp. PR83 TaxID=2884908 RepID=UPI001F42679F|nr:NACHT domain-containing protein [Actinokineospora sp. PR83]MCG8914653.1 NACHT domain-containing protein [Actinokineospora sp. PR83]